MRRFVLTRARWIAPLAGLLALILFAIGHGQRTSAQEEQPTPQAQAQWTLHLLETARYSEAVPCAQRLVDTVPNDPLAYEVRGVLALHIGASAQATTDFGSAAALAPRSPTAQYGLALCALFAHHADEAQADLSAAAAGSPQTPAQAADIDTALACLRFARGDVAGAQALAEKSVPASADGSDPLRQELLALAAARVQPQQGTALLAAFLSTPGGAPRVREDSGVRPLFDPARFVEPSVTEPVLQQMYQTSLREQLAQGARRVQQTAALSGDCALDAPTAPGAAFAAFYVDGQMLSMVNTAPYRCTWHTVDAANGWHVLRVETLDSGGHALLSQTRQVRVNNRNAPVAAQSELAAGDPQMETRIWNLLRLRPARKVAEWTLARLAEQRGDEADAIVHRTVAAALDPDYKDARHVARLLFRSCAPPPMPVPVRVASVRPDGLWVGNEGGKQVALTFDDGPTPAHTPALLDALDKAQAPATFFVVGARAEAAPELIHRMVARGDEIEDHSYTHPNMALTPPSLAESEILRASVMIRALSGRQPRFFRPPGGQVSPAVIALARAYGQDVAFWTVDVLKAEDAGSVQGEIDFVMQHMHPGAIVLLHNGTEVTTQAVPGLVAALRAKGYHLVTLSRLTASVAAAKPARVKE